MGNVETKQEKIDRIIQNRIIPFVFKIIGSVPKGLDAMLKSTCRLTIGVEGQYIEESGGAEEGHLLFIDSGIVQNFYYDQVKKKYITNYISKKYDVIIDVNSFLNHTERIGDIQMLEAGTLLSITYSNLRLLLANFPVLHVIQWQLEAEREKQAVYYQYLLKLKLDEKVKKYLDDNPGIATRINQDYIASYLGSCRARFSTSYAKYLNAKAKA